MSLDRILHVPDSYRASGNAGKYLVTRGIVRICYRSCSTATSLYLKHYFVFEFVVMSGSQLSGGRPWSSKISPVDQAPPPHKPCASQKAGQTTSLTDREVREGPISGHHCPLQFSAMVTCTSLCISNINVV